MRGKLLFREIIVSEDYCTCISARISSADVVGINMSPIIIGIMMFLASNRVKTL